MAWPLCVHCICCAAWRHGASFGGLPPCACAARALMCMQCMQRSLPHWWRVPRPAPAVAGVSWLRVGASPCGKTVTFGWATSVTLGGSGVSRPPPRPSFSSGEVLYVNNYVAVYARSGPLVLTRPRSLAVRPGMNVVVVNSTLYRSKRTHARRGRGTIPEPWGTSHTEPSQAKREPSLAMSGQVSEAHKGVAPWSRPGRM